MSYVKWNDRPSAGWPRRSAHLAVVAMLALAGMFQTPARAAELWVGCPCNFRRIVAELPSMVYYRDDQGLAVNLYTPSQAECSLGDGLKVAVRQATDYPNSGRVVIGVNPTRAAEFALRLRIPA